MKRLFTAAKLCLALVLAVSLVMAVRSWLEHQAGKQSYEQAAAIAFPAREGSGGAAPPAAASAPEEASPLIDVDLAALQAVNPDVVGWIEIPGTQLSYPLVQGKDNQYYLNRTWNRERNSMGAIYLECTNSPALDGFHTLVYGHRMNNDTMFGTLKYYKNLDFWQEHPSIYLAVESGVYRYDIFSAREAGVKGLVYRLDIEESGLKENFLQSCIEDSVIDTGVAPTADDRILTLSTCTGSGHATRWVVHGALSEYIQR